MYDTRNNISEELWLTPANVTIPNTSLEVHHTEISPTDKAENNNHVPGEIFSYTTKFPDQNFILDQRDPLYAYKAISHLYTLYLHEAMKTTNWPNYRLTMQK